MRQVRPAACKRLLRTIGSRQTLPYLVNHDQRSNGVSEPSPQCRTISSWGKESASRRKTPPLPPPAGATYFGGRTSEQGHGRSYHAGRSSSRTRSSTTRNEDRSLPINSKLTTRQGAQSSRTQKPPHGPPRVVQHLGPTSRIVRGARFVPWLTERLTSLSDSPDLGYAQFLKRLLVILKQAPTWIALKDQDVQSTHDKTTPWTPNEQSKPLALFRRLQVALVEGGIRAFTAQLEYTYNGILIQKEHGDIGKDASLELLDLRYPPDWFVQTREQQRTVHLHIGPTNSGKTYHALKALEAATCGVYLSPLRLLAHEVYLRMNAMGRPCNLLTGDEVRSIHDVGLRSCTVEMAPLSLRLDVAVLDEIQMIGDPARGWAWTQAFLGLQAKELHLCGEERVLPLIRDLIGLTGDRLEIHQYERLNPLEVSLTSLGGNFRNLTKGDCVVAFSKATLFTLKSQIEDATGKRVAIVYGSLPPEVRSQQAKLFNDPDNDYDYLVASDAVGMGLNLAIQRIIFESVFKYKEVEGDSVPIPMNQIKQIAGRAGRFRVASRPMLDTGDAGNTLAKAVEPVGIVTTLNPRDLLHVRKAMQTEPPPLMTAGIIPPNSSVVEYAERFPPSVRLSFILSRFQSLASTHPRYHLCAMQEQKDIADIIHPVTGITMTERLKLCQAPLDRRNPELAKIMQVYAWTVSKNTSGKLLSIEGLPLDLLDQPIDTSTESLRKLETLHGALILYLWLGYRFAGCFVDRSMAMYLRKIVEAKIDIILEASSAQAEASSKRRIARARAQRLALRKVFKAAVRRGASFSDAPNSEESPDAGLSSKMAKTALNIAPSIDSFGVNQEPIILGNQAL